MDWDDGDYELTAAALAPASDEVLDVVGVTAGQRLLDVACGTGNAALTAAARGATVMGVDSSPGLIERARSRASADGMHVEFAVGDAERLPVADAGFDVVVSVFGVIFADDPAAAVAELVRTTRPGGTIALTTWLPGGAVGETARLLATALPPPRGPRRRWTDLDWVEELLGGAGARELDVRHAQLSFTAESPRAWLDEQEREHPVWQAVRRRADAPAWAALHERSLAGLENGNEDPSAFRATSQYAVVMARR